MNSVVAVRQNPAHIKRIAPYAIGPGRLAAVAASLSPLVRGNYYHARRKAQHIALRSEMKGLDPAPEVRQPVRVGSAESGFMATHRQQGNHNEQCDDLHFVSLPARRRWGLSPTVCGGTTEYRKTIKETRQGLSPRVRENRRHSVQAGRRRRSIPACAGEPLPIAVSISWPACHRRRQRADAPA